RSAGGSRRTRPRRPRDCENGPGERPPFRRSPSHHPRRAHPVTPPFSRYIVFVDEAGDHGPVSPEFAVFVLAFCIFDKLEYANTVTSWMHRLKFKHVGHDTIVLHEREIRKALRPFDFLQNPERREAFMSDLSFLVEKSPFTIFAAVIDKLELRKRYNAPPNPY